MLYTVAEVAAAAGKTHSYTLQLLKKLDAEVGGVLIKQTGTPGGKWLVDPDKLVENHKLHLSLPKTVASMSELSKKIEELEERVLLLESYFGGHHAMING